MDRSATDSAVAMELLKYIVNPVFLPPRHARARQFALPAGTPRTRACPPEVDHVRPGLRRETGYQLSVFSHRHGDRHPRRVGPKSQAPAHLQEKLRASELEQRSTALPQVSNMVAAANCAPLGLGSRQLQRWTCPVQGTHGVLSRLSSGPSCLAWAGPRSSVCNGGQGSLPGCQARYQYSAASLVDADNLRCHQDKP